MSWRLTPEERRIIERTRREGAQTQSSTADGDVITAPAESTGIATPTENTGIAAPTESTGITASADERTPGETAQVPLWRSVLSWIGGIALFVLLALLMVWVGSLLG